MLIPPVKLFEAGRLRQDIVDILSANSRLPGSLYGDLNGQINALDLGTKHLTELLDEFGDDVVLEAMALLKERASKLIRSHISSLPDSIVSAEDFLDSDGIVDDR